MKVNNKLLVNLVAEIAKVSPPHTAKVIKALTQVVGEFLNEGCAVEIDELGEFVPIPKRGFKFNADNNSPLPGLPPEK